MDRQHEAESDPSTSMIDYPASSDVILGRGSLRAWHPGNRSFMQRIDAIVRPYVKARSKSVKSQIIQHIYDATLGRFLMQVSRTDAFEEVSEEVAKEKISQIIRYRRRVALQEEEPEEDDNEGEADNDQEGQDDEAVDEMPDIMPIPLSDIMPANIRRNNAQTQAIQPELFSDEELLSVLGWFLDSPTAESNNGPI